MFKLSQVLTELFSPFVLSGLLLVQIALATDPTWGLPVLICLVFIVGIPFALSWWMHATGRTSDRYIQDRRQRTPFYAATFASYLVGAILLNIISTSSQVCLTLNLSLISLAVVAAFESGSSSYTWGARRRKSMAANRPGQDALAPLAMSL